KQCEEECEETDDCTVCAPGQSEHDPSSCGNDECAAVLNDFAENADAMMAGLETCEGDMLAGAQMYMQMGADYLRFAAISTAGQCGLSDEVNVDFGTEPSCMAGVAATTPLESICPQRCNDWNGEDGGMPGEDGICAEDEDSRDQDSCGTSECQDYLEAVLEDMAHIKSSLEMCADTDGPFAGYGGYVGQLEGMVESLMYQCGFTDAPCYESCEAPPATCEELYAAREAGGCLETCSTEVLEGLIAADTENSGHLGDCDLTRRRTSHQVMMPQLPRLPQMPPLPHMKATLRMNEIVRRLDGHGECECDDFAGFDTCVSNACVGNEDAMGAVALANSCYCDGDEAACDMISGGEDDHDEGCFDDDDQVATDSEGQLT
ncbi:hypothetical protein TeGR_g4923, partial [Tetraparma gracilis]